MCGGNCSVHAHTYITHTAQTFSAVQMLPPVSQRMQKGWDRQTAGVGGQLRWTDPVGKPQAGRHTTAAAYLLNVGFERLATLFIETRFKRTNRRCGWRAGDIARKKKCFRISLVISYNFSYCQRIPCKDQNQQRSIACVSKAWWVLICDRDLHCRPVKTHQWKNSLLDMFCHYNERMRCSAFWVNRTYNLIVSLNTQWCSISWK